MNWTFKTEKQEMNYLNYSNASCDCFGFHITQVANIAKSVNIALLGNRPRLITKNFKSLPLQTTMICFLIHWQPWCAFWQKNDMVFQLILFNLFIRAYHRITYKEDLKIT